MNERFRANTGRKITGFALTVMALALAACGGSGSRNTGGGGGGGGTPNTPPVANAGPDQSVTEGSTVTLAGSGTDSDGSVASFSWRQTRGPAVAISDSAIAGPQFQTPGVSAVTVLTFQLTVTDDDGASHADTVDVTVNPNPALNQPPSAAAGADRTVATGAVVVLTGTGNDPDGTLTAYAWQQTAGPAVALAGSQSPTASFTAPAVPAELDFELTVTDNEGAQGSDSVHVSVVQPPADVTVSGAVSYDRVPHSASGGLNYPLTYSLPVRGATVELVDVGSGSTLASSRTDANGDYALTAPGATQVYVRVLAELRQITAPTWNFTVVDNTSGDALYAVESAPFDSGVSDSTLNLHAPSGWTGVSYGAARAAAPFAILDNAYDVREMLLAAAPGTSIPPLKYHWSTSNRPVECSTPNDPGRCDSVGEIGTSYYRSSGAEIFLLGAANSDTDEYDSHVVVHETGHYFEDRYARSDSVGGSHSFGDRLDPRVAFSEGWATALAGFLLGDPVYADAQGSAQSGGFTFNVESNSNTNPGWYSEGSVLSILYDVMDGPNDDLVSLGFAPMYEVFTNDVADAGSLTTIFLFVSHLIARNPGDDAAINSLLSAQSINPTGLDEYGSTETNNAGSGDVLPVYTPLTPDGSTITLCSIDTFGTFNKLSNRRYASFTIPAPGNYRLSATGGPPGSDPDLALYRQGFIDISEGVADGSETFSRFLQAGEYVLVVYEWSNLTDSPRGRTCFSVSVAPN